MSITAAWDVSSGQSKGRKIHQFLYVICADVLVCKSKSIKSSYTITKKKIHLAVVFGTNRVILWLGIDWWHSNADFSGAGIIDCRVFVGFIDVMRLSLNLMSSSCADWIELTENGSMAAGSFELIDPILFSSLFFFFSFFFFVCSFCDMIAAVQLDGNGSAFPHRTWSDDIIKWITITVYMASSWLVAGLPR